MFICVDTSIFEMKKNTLFASCILTFSTPILRGQNLVVNPSFEIPADSNRLIQPGEFSLTRAKGWTTPSRAQASLYSSIPTMATVNRSMSKWKFTAKEGNNVVGVSTYGMMPLNEKQELREYAQGTLTRPLTVGKKYFVSYYVHFHCEGTNNLGMAFSTRPLSTDSVYRLPLKPLINCDVVINYTPTSGWQQIRDSFVAREPFTNFIMGNFLTNKETKIQANQFHYHKAYLDEIMIEEAQEVKVIASRTFDLVADHVYSNTNNSANVNNSSSIPSVSSTTNNSPAAARVLKGDVLVLDKVSFEFNASSLETTSSTQLDKLVVFLQRNPNMKILVKGHTSSEGSDDYNMKLSESRAQSVVNYVTSKNINADRLSFKGMGETQPVATNETEEGRQKNRRVEFEITE